MSIKVLVTTAFELSKSNDQLLKKFLTDKYGKDSEIEYKIDSTLIGGLKLQVDHQEIDASLNKKVEVLRQQLLANVDKI